MMPEMQPDPEKSSQITTPLTLVENLRQLEIKRLGGFKLFAGNIDDADYLDPSRPALQNEFLNNTTAEGKKKRVALRQRLERWKAILSEEDMTSEQMANKVLFLQKTVEKLYKDNLATIVAATRDYERTYEGVKLFFVNAADEYGFKGREVTFMNVPISNLNIEDNDNIDSYPAVEAEIHQYYDQLDLTDSYSLLVIPGFLGNYTTLKYWAKVAHDHKLQLVTDYRDMSSVEQVLKKMKSEDKFAQDDFELSNVILLCNYLVARSKHIRIGESEDLYVPPSSALAGRMYSSSIAQVIAGNEHGELRQVQNVRFKLDKTTLTELREVGLVPTYYQWKKVVGASDVSLYKGVHLGWQTYSVVRTFDWIMRTSMNFLGKKTFSNWTWEQQSVVHSQLMEFLSKLKRHNIIKDFEQPKFTKDGNEITIEIDVVPIYPAVRFFLNLKGRETVGDTGSIEKSFESSFNRRP